MKKLAEMSKLSPSVFWEIISSHGAWHTLRCSGCGMLVNIRSDYRNPACCPKCGVKMDNGGM